MRIYTTYSVISCATPEVSLQKLQGSIASWMKTLT